MLRLVVSGKKGSAAKLSLNQNDQAFYIEKRDRSIELDKHKAISAMYPGTLIFTFFV